MSSGEEAAARALRAVGTAFRLHGRQTGVALDCIGLAAHAVGLKNIPANYSLKGTHNRRIISYLDVSEFRSIAPDAGPDDGDLALVQCGPRQYHLMIHANHGWVHAHAGLRRVVHMPGPSPWPIIALWRISGD